MDKHLQNWVDLVTFSMFVCIPLWLPLLLLSVLTEPTMNSVGFCIFVGLPVSGSTTMYYMDVLEMLLDRIFKDQKSQ